MLLLTCHTELSSSDLLQEMRTCTLDIRLHHFSHAANARKRKMWTDFQDMSGGCGGTEFIALAELP